MGDAQSCGATPFSELWTIVCPIINNSPLQKHINNGLPAVWSSTLHKEYYEIYFNFVKFMEKELRDMHL
jgi:hypothetical protein